MRRAEPVKIKEKDIPIFEAILLVSKDGKRDFSPTEVALHLGFERHSGSAYVWNTLRKLMKLGYVKRHKKACYSLLSTTIQPNDLLIS